MPRRVLWVTSSPPGFRHQGGTIRQAHLIAALAARAEVDLLVTAPLADDSLRARLSRVVEVALRPPSRSLLPPKAGRRLRSLTSALGLRPPLVLRDERASVAALIGPIRELIANNEYDAVIVQQLGLAPLIERVPRQAPAATAGPFPVRPVWIAEIHDTPSITLAQRRAIASTRRTRWLLAREYEQARRVERSVRSTYDKIVAVSEEDAAAFGEGTVVMPNGADFGKARATELPKDPRLLFLGTLSYHPNADGIGWFCDEVLPHIRAAVPEVELEVVGRDPGDDVLALAERPGVSVHANVPDVAPFLEKARVCIVPLRFGSGTRLKALEASVAGRPVAGTSVGLAGLGLENGKNVRIEDDPQRLARAIQALLEDDQLSRSLARAAREHVARHFDWTAIGARYCAAVLGSAAPPS